jgi:multiple sugar transport system substrate-binding protein
MAKSAEPITGSAVSATRGPCSRRRLLHATLAAAGASAVFAAACQQAGETPGAAGPSKAPVTIQYGTGLSERMTQNYQDLLVAQFESKFPHVKVQVDPNAHAYTDKFKAAMAGGTVFDAVWEADNATYLQGFVADMAGYAKRDKFNLAAFPKSLFDSILTFKGAVTGIPNQTGGNLMAVPYNRTLLQRAGLREPPTEWGDRSWTWDAFVDYCKKTTISAGGKLASTGAPATGTGVLVGNQPFLFGGQWISGDRTKAVCDSAEMIRCYQAYFGMAVDGGGLLRSGQGAELFGTNDAPTLLAEGNVAFLLSMSSATLGTILDKVRGGADVAFAPLPRDKNVASFQWLDSNGVVKGAKYPDQAWQYVAWQGSTFNWAKSRGTPPPRKEHIEQWAKEFYPDIPEKTRFKVVLQLLEHPGPYDPGWVLPKFGFNGTDAMRAWINDVYAGKAAVADGLRTLKPQLQSMLDAEEAKYKG